MELIIDQKLIDIDGDNNPDVKLIKKLSIVGDDTIVDFSGYIIKDDQIIFRASESDFELFKTPIEQRFNPQSLYFDLNENKAKDLFLSLLNTDDLILRVGYIDNGIHYAYEIGVDSNFQLVPNPMKRFEKNS